MNKPCSVCAAEIKRWHVSRIDGNAPKRLDLCLTCRAVFRRLGVLERISHERS